MLSNIASYLGYTTTSATAKCSESDKGSTNVGLRAVEDDEWLLVENNDNERARAAKKEAEDGEMTRVTLAVSTWPSAPVPTNGQGVLRPEGASALQESWYLTPPPSFTSEGPVHMETSPLENLLIEHPSMSVYERPESAVETKKMSHSSPSTASGFSDSRCIIPEQEPLYNIPQNESSPKSNELPAPSSEKSETEEKPVENKESKMKNFVKSPRRSMNAEIQNFPKKAPRKRPEGSEKISKISLSQESVKEEQTPLVPPVQRRLYSEVLASKPKTAAVPVEAPIVNSPAPVAEAQNPRESEPEPEAESTPEALAAIPESKEASSPSDVEADMSVDSQNSQQDSEDRDRWISEDLEQIFHERQNRLHFLNRSAQKVEMRKTCDYMKKNNIVRTNKARELNYRNKRQRRADMMQRHSGANNNRKCAKTCVY